MNELEIIINSYKQFLSTIDTGEYIEESGMHFIKSGSISRDMNICIIEKISDFSIQKELFAKNFNVNGFVFSFPSSRFILQNMSSRIIYAGRVGAMKSSGMTSYTNKNNFDVIKMSPSDIDDYVDFICSERNIEKNIFEKIVQANIQSLHAYLAYENNGVVGVGYAIQNQNNIFVLDTLVKDEKKNSGVLSAIVQTSMLNETKAGFSNFLSIVSSSYSQKAVLAAGYKEMLLLDLWISKEG